MSFPLMRSCLDLIKPYIPGKPVEEVERELGLSNVIKLASNENALGPSPLAIKAMRDNAHKMNIYPDGNCYYLRDTLASKLKVKKDQLIFGNGSDEILSLLTLALISPGDEAVMVEPSFSEYDFAVRLMGGVPRLVPLTGPEFAYNFEAVLAAINDQTRIVFICSPNNPTGSHIQRADLECFLNKLPEKVLVVLDQAYIEYVSDPDHPEGLDLINQGYPLIALRTFSKIYGLAGLRIGYGIASSALIAGLNRVREPFNVNAMAQLAALASLSDTVHLKKSVALVEEGRKMLSAGLAELGLMPVPDQSNFCFIDIRVDSHLVFQALLKKGVIVRTGDIFGCPSYIRVTYGTKKQNERFLSALGEVLADLGQ